jgi:hypothetical protein
MPEVSCIHPDCAARMPRRVNYCPYCGASQVREAMVMPAKAGANASPRMTVPVPTPTPAPAQAAPAREPAQATKRESRSGGLGFWIVALLVVFSFWISL